MMNFTFLSYLIHLNYHWKNFKGNNKAIWPFLNDEFGIFWNSLHFWNVRAFSSLFCKEETSWSLKWHSYLSKRWHHNRELKQPRRRRQQKPHKFAYLTMKNSIFARFAGAFFIFWQFEDVLVLSTTWYGLFCSCVDDVSIWWQIFLCPKRWFQFNSRIVRTHFSSIMILNNWKMIAETRSYIFRWRSRFRWRCVCLSSLIWYYRLLGRQLGQ